MSKSYLNRRNQINQDFNDENPYARQKKIIKKKKPKNEDIIEEFPEDDHDR